MDKRKRNLNPKDHQVLVRQAVVAIVPRAIVLTINTAIKKRIKLNQNLRTKKLKQIVLKENEDRVLETEVDLIQDQSVVHRIQDIGVGLIQGMIEDLHIVLDRDNIDLRCRVVHIPKSIKANEIVLLAQMIRGVINTGTDDNILVKLLFKVVKILNHCYINTVSLILSHFSFILFFITHRFLLNSTKKTKSLIFFYYLLTTASFFFNI